MLLPLILLACGTSTQPADSPAADSPEVPAVGFDLAYSGNVDGEIEPCG